MGQMALSRTPAIVPAAAAAAVSRAETNPPPNHPMHIQPLPTRMPVSRCCVFAIAVLSLLVGCAPSDLGQINSTFVRDDIHDWLSLDAIAGRPTLPSHFELTGDERQLRDLAYPLISAPYDRQQWYSVFGEYGAIGSEHRAVFDRTAYLERLKSSRYRSPSARYSQLIDDIRNDVTRLPQFFETAARVLDIDQKRRKSLAYISDPTPMERANTLRRINENALLVSLVRAKLAQRVTSYRFALERLVIMTPLPEAVEVERSLNQLQAQIVHYRTHSAPTLVRGQSLAAAR
jgi:hypothetical protein